MTGESKQFYVDTELEFSGGTLIANINTFSDSGGTTKAGLVDASRRVLLSPSSTVLPKGSLNALLLQNPSTGGLEINSGFITSSSDTNTSVSFLTQGIPVPTLAHGWNGTYMRRLRTVEPESGGTIASIGLLAEGNFGHDGTNWRTLMLDATGNIVVSSNSTITSVPSGTQDINIVGDTVNLMKSTGGTLTALQGTDPWNSILSSGTNAIGYLYGSSSTVNAVQYTSPWITQSNASSTANVVIQTDNASLMKRTSGTIAEVTLVPNVTTVGTVSSITAGNITTTSSSTANCIIQSDNASLMKNTGGTIAQVTLVPTVTTVGTVSAITGGNITTTSSSTANCVLQTDNLSLMKSTGGTLTPITASGNAFVEASALSGGTSSTTGLLSVGNLNYNGAAWIDRNVPVINDAQYTTTVTSGTIWTPTGGKKFVMTDMLISTKDATGVSILDGTTKVFEAYLAANGGVVSNFKTPIQSTTADNSLHITTDTASTLSITTTGYEF